MASVAHLRGALAAANGAGSTVTLSLALVSPGHDEHGRTIHDTETESTNRNTSRGGLLLGRLIVGSIVAEGVIVLGAIIPRGLVVTSSTAIAITKEVDLSIDDGSQVSDNLIFVVVKG